MNKKRNWFGNISVTVTTLGNLAHNHKLKAVSDYILYTFG